jgi:hypothetical protein
MNQRLADHCTCTCSSGAAAANELGVHARALQPRGAAPRNTNGCAGTSRPTSVAKDEAPPPPHTRSATAHATGLSPVCPTMLLVCGSRGSGTSQRAATTSVAAAVTAER